MRGYPLHRAARKPRQRYVHVLPDGAEVDFRRPPKDCATLLVKIIDKQEETFTYDDGEGKPVPPPGARWKFDRAKPPNSSAWRRPREPRLTLVVGESYQEWTSRQPYKQRREDK
jgi:hypothetical protein